MKTLFPNDWRLMPLKQVVDKNRPITYGIVQAGPHIEDGIPYIRVSDMTKGRLTLDGMLRTSKEIAHKYKRSTVLENDIVFALRGVAGSVLKVPSEISGANLTQGTARIAPSNEVISNYLVYAIGSSLVQRDIEKRLKGSTFKEISLAELEKIKIPIPPLSEQQKIAEILAYWDEAITKTERLIVALRARKKSLIQCLLTGQVRFPEFNGEWKEYELEQVASKNRYSFTGGPFGSNLKAESYTLNGVRIIQLQNIGDGEFLDKYKIYTSEEKADELISCNIYPGDIILSKMGDPVARATIIPNTEKRYLMASDGIRLEVNKERFDTQFILETINAFEFRKNAIRHSVGSTRQRISLSDLRNLPINTPPLAEQQRISSVLQACNQEIELTHQKLELLKQQKKGLMQKLLTGQIRVKV